MFAKQFDVQGSMAFTLSPEDVCGGHSGETGWHSRTHGDGWTISGAISEDYYHWVNDFEAHHPRFGRVWGNFEGVVYADSQEAFEAFYATHTPESWDYYDI